MKWDSELITYDRAEAIAYGFEDMLIETCRAEKLIINQTDRDTIRWAIIEAFERATQRAAR